MPAFQLEYALSVFQNNIFSFAAKEHRRVGGNPGFDINIHQNHVEFVFYPLTQGVPGTNNGEPLKNRFDIYFLLPEVCPVIGTWPATNAQPAKWSVSSNNAGTERLGGKSIKMTTPLGRLPGVSEVVAEVNIQTQPFTATAQNLTIFADIEFTPVGKLYQAQYAQLHFGFQGNYQFTGGIASNCNRVTVKVSHEIYEAIRSKIFQVCTQ
jgi:hypothetical protein